ncbi:MAG: LptF/LptG family permease [Planctomycetes bacterium]|nr:LptF/LptG family permease [Planctomycetota bacterium]
MKLFVSILRELTEAFLFAVVGLFVIALPVIAVAAVAKLQGVNTLGVLRFLPLLIAGLIPYVLPLSFLLAVVSTYGRLAADNEWTAIRMAGWNPLRMVLPGLVLGLGLALGTDWMLEEFMPPIRRAQEGYRFQAIREQFKELKPGETELQLEKFFLSSAWREGDDFLNAVLFVPEHGKERARWILAERVRFQFTEKEVFLFLQKARILVGPSDVRNENPVFRIDLGQLQPEKEGSFGATRHKTSAELAQLVLDPKTPAPKKSAYVYEIHNRRALSSTYLMFLLLGVPTGILLRKGTQLGALSAAVGYALAFYLLSMRLSKELSTSHVLPPAVGAWCVVGVGALVGAYLMRRAVRR